MPWLAEWWVRREQCLVHSHATATTLRMPQRQATPASERSAAQQQSRGVTAQTQHGARRRRGQGATLLSSRRAGSLLSTADRLRSHAVRTPQHCADQRREEAAHLLMLLCGPTVLSQPGTASVLRPPSLLATSLLSVD